ncbi:MAG: hypothetical protein HY216_08380, partial [Candidatus Rokubacteria bacterium]|nr:hypothetical protein [Candidatus Rokubacteria bacterium]
MKKFLAVLASVVALLGLAAPAMAQAPAPKVTINGLVDFVATAYSNWSGGLGANCQQSGTNSVPSGSTAAIGGGVPAVAAGRCSLDATLKDTGMYSRERGVFTLTGEIGKSKGVWALELDFTNGAGVANGGNPLGTRNQTAFPGTTASLDLDTDVPGAVETKWLYLETPVTGPGSLMPFIPVSSIMRAGGQPARGHEYKVGILLGGDMPGVTLETTWAPNLRSTVTFVQIGEKLDKFLAPGQAENVAFLGSVEWDVFKGLTVKPTYAYAFIDGGQCGTTNLGLAPKDGVNFNTLRGGCVTQFSPNSTNISGFNGSATSQIVGFTNSSLSAAGDFLTAGPVATVPLATRRQTFGGDVRWTSGPFTVQPTFLYQWGTQEIPAVANTGRGQSLHSVDIRSYIFDTSAGFRTGPLNIEGRFMHTPGMGASQHVLNGAKVGYYEPIN